MFRRSDVAGAIAFVLVATCAGIAHADEPSPAPEEDPDVVRAREEFRVGADAAKRNRWNEALISFERSLKLRKHAVTTYNVALCERALGQYTRARQTLRHALDDNEAAGGRELATTQTDNARAYLGQIEALLAKVDVHLAPDDVELAVDGRPLERDASSDPKSPVWVAGTQPPGPGERAPSAHFQLAIDPGHHIFVLSRTGLKPIVLNRSFEPGQAIDLPLALDKLDAQLVVETRDERALVTVDDVDVGYAPVSLRRPAGRYHVTVRRRGFIPYAQDVALEPGATVKLTPQLAEEKTALTQRWWFWAGAAAILVGTGVGVYYATAPSPQRPAPDGGGLGWSVDIR